MSIARTRGDRLRNARDVEHAPSGHGKGKWHSLATLFAYKLKARRKRHISEASRRHNRMAA